jgi:hypothetical protein
MVCLLQSDLAKNIFRQCKNLSYVEIKNATRSLGIHERFMCFISMFGNLSLNSMSVVLLSVV